MNCIPTANDLSSGWMLLKKQQIKNPKWKVCPLAFAQRWMFPSLASHEALPKKFILQPNRQGPQAVPVYVRKNNDISFIRASSSPQTFLGLKNLPIWVRDREELS